jgi:phosphoglycerate transport regulatory protein PgtC
MNPFTRSAIALLLLLFPLWAVADTHKKRLVVVTTYPEEVFSQFEAAFEKRYPDINVDILWQRPLGSVDSVQQQAVDVYWAPSRQNFVHLSQSGAFQKLTLDRTGLPDRIGSFLLSDPNGYYVATEVAGFGFAINHEYLQQHQLPVPKGWIDLAQPIYATHIAFPIPSKVGFAPAIIDLILQAYGWQAGWALLSEIAANSYLMDFTQGETVIDRLVGGKNGIGLSIDFFAAAKIANNVPLDFIYPKMTAYSPAYVAILAKTTAPKEAQQFVEFLVSDAGQKTLFNPDIRKLPIRPTIYQDAPEGYYNPFVAIHAMDNFTFDNQLGIASSGINVALFDQLFTRRHPQLKQLWQMAQRAENLVKHQYNPYLWQQIQQAKQAIVKVPLTASEAASPALQQIFTQRKSSAAFEAQAVAIETQWGVIIDQNYQCALKLIQDVIATY